MVLPERPLNFLSQSFYGHGCAKLPIFERFRAAS